MCIRDSQALGGSQEAVPGPGAAARSDRNAVVRQHRGAPRPVGGRGAPMMLVDANLLIYAYNPAAEQHAAAKHWFEATVSGPVPVRLAWTSVMAFVRIMTNPQLFRRPLTPAEAVAVVDGWLDHPGIALLEPGERHLRAHETRHDLVCRLLLEK